MQAVRNQGVFEFEKLARHVLNQRIECIAAGPLRVGSEQVDGHRLCVQRLGDSRAFNRHAVIETTPTVEGGLQICQSAV